MRSCILKLTRLLPVVSALATLSCAPSTKPEPKTPEQPSSNSQSVAATSNDNASKLPDFTLESVNGDSISLSSYLGKKVILIDFWATWCEPCLAAMPHLNDLYKKYSDDGFVILSVAMDGPDTVAEVRSYANRHDLQFPILLDQESRAVALYNPRRSAPYSVLIGLDGNIISKHDGYQPGDEVGLEKEISRALPGNK